MTGKADYGWDAPYVARNNAIAAALCGVAAMLVPSVVHVGSVALAAKQMLFWTAASCAVTFLLFLHYVKRGKLRHREFLLRLHLWHGDESVLDVGCGRGLLLVGAAKRLTTGHATGLDSWSAEDLSGNSAQATERNAEAEGVAGRCSVVTGKAEALPFADESFHVVVSNLCLHNLYDPKQRHRALLEVARVLRVGGTAYLSDYKLTDEYAGTLRSLGFKTHRRWGSLIDCFPPMRIVVARKLRETGS